MKILYNYTVTNHIRDLLSANRPGVFQQGGGGGGMSGHVKPMKPHSHGTGSKCVVKDRVSWF